ncbi:MAG TPA: glutaredoxin family protein [Burkholderiales bacterium]|nr:glutaredoxin family protein [Burkholderiales bacterium]
MYGRAYCHLCEEMAAALRSLGVDFEEIDVDADPRLDELYGENVPVLLRGDIELCRHRLTSEAIAKLR